MTLSLSIASILLLVVILILLAQVARRASGLGLALFAAFMAARMGLFSGASDLSPAGDGQKPTFRFPLAEPEVYLAFGRTTSKGVHLGVDLGPADGDTRVFPIAPGTVVCSGWNGGVGPGCDLEPPDPQPGKGLGWFVVLEHRLPRGDSHRRVYSVYGHLASRPLYSSGEEVTSVDEPLGFMGDTGGASAPHLHLEIQDGDRWEDFTFGDTEHGFSYAPPAQVLTDPWYERYLDPVDFIERRSVWRQ